MTFMVLYFGVNLAYFDNSQSFAIFELANLALVAPKITQEIEPQKRGRYASR
jgi:hypothetical protein